MRIKYTYHNVIMDISIFYDCIKFRLNKVNTNYLFLNSYIVVLSWGRLVGQN